MNTKSTTWHISTMLDQQRRKRRSAAVEFLVGVALALLGFFGFPWLLLPAGGLMGWGAKTLLEAHRIDTAFRG